MCPHSTRGDTSPQQLQQVGAEGTIQNNCTILCDYNDLDCLTGTNGTTGAQRFLTALSHRFANGFLGKCRRTGPMLALADDAALARLVIAATAIPAARVRGGCAISLVRSKTVRRVGRASAVMQRGSAQSFYGT